jgi:hypothetical protein
MIVMRSAVMPLAGPKAEPITPRPPWRRARAALAGEPIRHDELAPPLPAYWLELAFARWRRHTRRQPLTRGLHQGWPSLPIGFQNVPATRMSPPPFHDTALPHMSTSQPPRGDPAGTAEAAEPARADEVVGADWTQSWHDSSYELRRGLLVIELDLDPRLTHGELVPVT